MGFRSKLFLTDIKNFLAIHQISLQKSTSKINIEASNIS